MSNTAKSKPQENRPVKKKETTSEIVEYQVEWNNGTNLSSIQFGDGRVDIALE